MLEIQVSSDIAGGKTAKLITMARDAKSSGKRVLFVCVNQATAASLQHKNSDIDFCGQAPALRKLRCSVFDVVILDDLDLYPATTPEGSLFEIARKSLINPFMSELIYSTSEPSKVYWVSCSVWWKPWTWGKGYWR